MDTDFSTYFLKHFPSLFMSFLFLFVVFVFETQPVMVAEPYIVVSQSKNLLRAVCLLPRALFGRL